MVQGRSIRLRQSVGEEAVRCVDETLLALAEEPEHFSSITSRFVRMNIDTAELCAPLVHTMANDEPGIAVFAAMLTLGLRAFREHEVDDETLSCAGIVISNVLESANTAVKQGICVWLRETFIPSTVVPILIRLSADSQIELAVNAACTVAICEVEMIRVQPVLTRHLLNEDIHISGVCALGLIRLGVRVPDAVAAIEDVFNRLELGFQLELLRAIRNSKKEVSHLRSLVERVLKRGSADPSLHYLAAQLLPKVDSNPDRVSETLRTLLSGHRCTNELLSGSINAFDEIERLGELEIICLAHIRDSLVEMRRTAARGLYVVCGLSETAIEVVAKRIPHEEDTAALEYLVSALIRSGERAIPYILPLIDGEPEKGRLDLYLSSLARIGRPGIEELGRYIHPDASRRMLHSIMGCIQRSGHGALGIVKPFCDFIDNTDDEEHLVNAIICILSVSSHPTEALPTLFSLISIRGNLSAAVHHWATLGIKIMKDDAIEYAESLATKNIPDAVRTRSQQMRDELADGFDPNLSYLARIKETHLIEQFVLVGSVLDEHPTWSMTAVADDLNVRTVPHPLPRLSEWKDTTIGKHLREFEQILGEGIRLTNRNKRKAGGLTEFGTQTLEQCRHYLKWLNRSRSAK